MLLFHFLATIQCKKFSNRIKSKYLVSFRIYPSGSELTSSRIVPHTKRIFLTSPTLSENHNNTKIEYLDQLTKCKNKIFGRLIFRRTVAWRILAILVFLRKIPQNLLILNCHIFAWRTLRKRNNKKITIFVSILIEKSCEMPSFIAFIKVYDARAKSKHWQKFAYSLDVRKHLL